MCGKGKGCAKSHGYGDADGNENGGINKCKKEGQQWEDGGVGYANGMRNADEKTRYDRTERHGTRREETEEAGSRKRAVVHRQTSKRDGKQQQRRKKIR